MDTELHNAITHLHQMLRDRGVMGDVTLQLSSAAECEMLAALLNPDAPAPAPLMDLEAFLAQSEVIGL